MKAFARSPVCGNARKALTGNIYLCTSIRESWHMPVATLTGHDFITLGRCLPVTGWYNLLTLVALCGMSDNVSQTHS